MSTRCNILIEQVLNNCELQVIMYHHCDGYPEGVGAQLEEILSSHKFATPYHVGTFLFDLPKPTKYSSGYEFAVQYAGDIEYVYTITLRDNGTYTLLCQATDEDANGELVVTSEVYVKTITPAEKQESEMFTNEPKQIITIDASKLKIEEYSDKAFVITGTDRTMSEAMKSLGGRYNSKLTCGKGWIFPKSKLDNVKQALNL